MKDDDKRMNQTLEELEATFEAYKDFDERYTPESFRTGYQRALIRAVPGLIARVKKLESVVNVVAKELATSQNCFLCPAGNWCGAEWKRPKAECQTLIRVALEKKAGEQ